MLRFLLGGSRQLPRVCTLWITTGSQSETMTVAFCCKKRYMARTTYNKAYEKYVALKNKYIAPRRTNTESASLGKFSFRQLGRFGFEANMFSQSGTFLLLFYLRRFYNKRGHGRQRNKMFRHNPCVLLMRLKCHLPVK